MSRSSTAPRRSSCRARGGSAASSSEATGFDWTLQAFPESDLSLGSSGNLWVVPENAANKELAYEFIDITMRPEIQAIIGNNGGVPVAADPADITDEKSAELIATFNGILDNDGLSFYPDWPAAGLLRRASSRSCRVSSPAVQDVETTNANLGDAVRRRNSGLPLIRPAGAVIRGRRPRPSLGVASCLSSPVPNAARAAKLPPEEPSIPQRKGGTAGYWLYLLPGFVLLLVIVIIPLSSTSI